MTNLNFIRIIQTKLNINELIFDKRLKQPESPFRFWQKLYMPKLTL